MGCLIQLVVFVILGIPEYFLLVYLNQRFGWGMTNFDFGVAFFLLGYIEGQIVGEILGE